MAPPDLEPPMSRPAWSLFNYQLIEPDEQLDLFACQEVRVHLVARQLELGAPSIAHSAARSCLRNRAGRGWIVRFSRTSACALCAVRSWSPRSGVRRRSGRSCVSSCRGQLEARFTYTIDVYLPVVCEGFTGCCRAFPSSPAACLSLHSVRPVLRRPCSCPCHRRVKTSSARSR